MRGGRAGFSRPGFHAVGILSRTIRSGEIMLGGRASTRNSAYANRCRFPRKASRFTPDTNAASPSPCRFPWGDPGGIGGGKGTIAGIDHDSCWWARNGG